MIEDEFQISYHDLEWKNKLSKQGRSTVFRGLYKGVPVAIKEFNIYSLDNGKLFQQELEMMRRLRHPNVIQFLGFCQEEGHYAIVMEYMPKGSLHQQPICLVMLSFCGKSPLINRWRER